MVTICMEDPSPEHVREWMDLRGYDFPVLWDDGYGYEDDLPILPGTRVLDPEGRMVFAFGETPGNWYQDVRWMVEDVLEGSDH